MQRKLYTLRSRECQLQLGNKTVVMGIVNCTPDSFSDGGELNAPEDAVQRALTMAAGGADIIDIGGESTRPGSESVPPQVELDRVIPVIEKLHAISPVWISVDTAKAPVAEEALRAGAHIINDISGLRADPGMPAIAKKYGVPVVVMHMLGQPGTMQNDPRYDDLLHDIETFFTDRIDSLCDAGLLRENIIIDPGIGFGKTVDHNLTLINRLDHFAALDVPLLIGVSRKSFIGKILDTPVNDRLEGTAAAVTIAIARGVHIIRVHDVQAMTRVARITDSILEEKFTDLN